MKAEEMNKVPVDVSDIIKEIEGAATEGFKRIEVELMPRAKCEALNDLGYYVYLIEEGEPYFRKLHLITWEKLKERKLNWFQKLIGVSKYE
jgi:hypothetical protein